MILTLISDRLALAAALSDSWSQLLRDTLEIPMYKLESIQLLSTDIIHCLTQTVKSRLACAHLASAKEKSEKAFVKTPW